jgi:predicted MFS family arabinose efflux permease
MDDKKRKYSVIILSIMVFLANGDNYASATLISSIAKDLGLTISAASISVTSYMLGFGLFTLIFGPLGDKYGKAKIVNIAATGTAIFSILGAVAFNLSSLVTFRLINGMFGSGIFPVALALIGEMFDDKDRHKAIAGVMSMGFLGSASATIIGGSISYLASWRMVYLVYGVGELILAIIMLKYLEKDRGVREHLELGKSYKMVLSDVKFMRLVALLFFIGFAVFGTFTYAGISLMDKTGYSILVVGFILASYGVGTVFGGKIASKLKMKLGANFLVLSGFIGFLSLILLSYTSNTPLIILSLFGFGISFIFIQSTLVSTLQVMLPTMKGTVMSLTSFNLFVGAAVGTSVNAKILEVSNMNRVYITAAIMIALIGIIASIYVSKFEKAQVKEVKKKKFA